MNVWRHTRVVQTEVTKKKEKKKKKESGTAQFAAAAEWASKQTVVTVNSGTRHLLTYKQKKYFWQPGSLPMLHGTSLVLDATRQTTVTSAATATPAATATAN
jgi:hypothetical protein